MPRPKRVNDNQLVHGIVSVPDSFFRRAREESGTETTAGKRLEIWAKSWKVAYRPNLNRTVSQYLGLQWL